jgi:hypothetical protein
LDEFSTCYFTRLLSRKPLLDFCNVQKSCYETKLQLMKSIIGNYLHVGVDAVGCVLSRLHLIKLIRVF